MRRLSPVACIAAAAALLVLTVLVAPYVSRSGLQSALVDLHRPRAILGAVAGCGLALAGAVLQAVLRNPLASPYTLGLSSGSAVGAALVIQLGLAASSTPFLWTVSATSLGALGGALLTAALVYGVARTRALAAETLLLTGVAVALFGGAAISMLHYLADTIDLMAMVRWSMGSLGVVGYGRVASTAAFVAVGAAVLLAVARDLEVASLDDDSARGLGVDPVRVRRLTFLGTSLITAGIVSQTGPVGFVGLIVPHAVRPFTGPDPRVLLPCAALAGGAFLVACDTVARTALYPTDLPINVITHAVGCPAFVWILVRRSQVGAP